MKKVSNIIITIDFWDNMLHQKVFYRDRRKNDIWATILWLF